MKKQVKTFSLLLFFSAFFMQIRPCLSKTPHANVDSLETLNKIAIAAVGDSVTSEISTMAGRAPYYLFFDMNGCFLKSLENPSLNLRGGARFGVIDLLEKESVKTVIAGNFGDKMKNLLMTHKIECYEYTGAAQVIVKKFIEEKRGNDAQEK